MTEAELFPILLYSWLGLAVLTALVLLKVSAPYGRHARDGWGPKVNAQLAWVVMEAPSPLLLALFFVLGRRTGDAAAVAFLIIWQVHYVHRAFVFPFRRRTSGQPVPVLILTFALVFNLMNTYLNGRHLFTFAPAYGASWLVDPRFIGGTALFVLGFAINQHADHVLINLRQPGESGYKIPQGGLYRWVSCPNYLGEILEWTGWAVATWSLPGLTFAIWTMANLVPRAVSHHRWYRQTFADYPASRKAMIPFLL